MALAMLLPWIALAIGWAAGKNWQSGAEAMLITFAVLFLAVGILLLTVRQPTALSASLPFVGALLYTLIPNPVPVPIDAFLAMLAGSLFSYVLWIKRWPALPRWVIGPMLLCSAYNLVGGFIPGPFDEIIAYCLILGAAGYHFWQVFESKRADAVTVTLDAKPADTDEAP